MARRSEKAHAQTLAEATTERAQQGVSVEGLTRRTSGNSSDGDERDSVKHDNAAAAAEAVEAAEAATAAAEGEAEAATAEARKLRRRLEETAERLRERDDDNERLAMEVRSLGSEVKAANLATAAASAKAEAAATAASSPSSPSSPSSLSSSMAAGAYFDTIMDEARGVPMLGASKARR